MINQAKSRQNWEIGGVVKVGFMVLRVSGVRSVKDGMPDIYDMESLDGARHYAFIPHVGLQRLDRSKDLCYR